MLCPIQSMPSIIKPIPSTFVANCTFASFMDLHMWNNPLLLWLIVRFQFPSKAVNQRHLNTIIEPQFRLEIPGIPTYLRCKSTSSDATVFIKGVEMSSICLSPSISSWRKIDELFLTFFTPKIMLEVLVKILWSRIFFEKWGNLFDVGVGNGKLFVS